ncbi:MAG: divergent polysaccharide deacetylase family protein [Spirochaetales bacterium]|nr:divergent polysaccharide deacetylase family protein [Spirochaetales bacterium]
MEKERLKAVLILLSVIIVLLFFAILLLEDKTKVSDSSKTLEQVMAPDIQKESELIQDEHEYIQENVIESPKGVLYFVIDDVGNNIFQLKPFLDLPMRMTFAVLPGLKYTEEAVRLIIAAGKDYIIHQPMEAIGGQNPGPGALLVGMNEEQVADIVTDNLKDYSRVRGMNNHMGSAGTADPGLMSILFKVLKEKDMYFLDSRTTSKSAGRETAEAVGIPFAERSIFLDNSKERMAILEAVENGLNVAEKRGHAIMIGHIWTEELADILLDLYPSLLENNYALNNLTELFTGNEFDEDSWY